jgi:hypothetical protein
VVISFLRIKNAVWPANATRPNRCIDLSLNNQKMLTIAHRAGRV